MASVRKPSQKAFRACARWLQTCLEIGWRKSDLDALEKLWWEHHDDNGKLKGEA